MANVPYDDNDALTVDDGSSHGHHAYHAASSSSSAPSVVPIGASSSSSYTGGTGSAAAAAAAAAAVATATANNGSNGNNNGNGVGLRTEAGRQQYVTSMKGFWQKQLEVIEKTDFKKLKHQLPLARIKKIMKSDEDVRMISAEAPVLFAKACELFILDLTMRAWAHTDDNKRRTLQRSDVAEAIASSEMFDFLIDIVPREENPNPAEEGSTEHLLRTFQRAPAFASGDAGQLRRPMDNPLSVYGAGTYPPSGDHGTGSSHHSGHHGTRDTSGPLPAGQSLSIEGGGSSGSLPSLPSFQGGSTVSEHDRASLAATMAHQRASSRASAETLPYSATHRPPTTR